MSNDTIDRLGKYAPAIIPTCGKCGVIKAKSKFTFNDAIVVFQGSFSARSDSGDGRRYQRLDAIGGSQSESGLSNILNCSAGP